MKIILNIVESCILQYRIPYVFYRSSRLIDEDGIADILRANVSQVHALDHRV